MKFLFVHNDYGILSGEEVTFDAIAALLAARGHEVSYFRRSSTEIPRRRFGKARAFVAGLYNPGAQREIRALVRRERPQIAFVQNLYPFISPAVLPVLRTEGVRVVMRVANYRLICPDGLLLSRGEICTRCTGGDEYWCVLRNCEQSLPKSIGYALRNAVARRRRWYLDNVAVYIGATRFLRDRLAAAGFDARRFHVIPNVVPAPAADSVRFGGGEYVGYVGRIAREKGIPVLLEAARLCPDLSFRLAGGTGSGYRLPDALPENVSVLGHLQGEELATFYRNARVIVNPSTCYETFGMSVAEAMLHARPVVVPDHGVFPELVRDGATGLLHEPGDAASLARCVQRIWGDPELGEALGRAARDHALQEYGQETYYARFMAACAAPTQGPVR